MINNETYKHEKKTDRLKNREKVGNITQSIFDIRRKNPNLKPGFYHGQRLKLLDSETFGF